VRQVLPIWVQSLAVRSVKRRTKTTENCIFRISRLRFVKACGYRVTVPACCNAGDTRASWRSGYAEDCKSLHPGSIPGEASNVPSSGHHRLVPVQAGLQSALVLCTTLAMFRDSSAVEQSTVNRLVAGSNPAPGAIFLRHLRQMPASPQFSNMI
jgi:hypothetical protein